MLEATPSYEEGASLPRTCTYASLIVLAAGVVRALIVRQRIETLYLVSILKPRE